MDKNTVWAVVLSFLVIVASVVIEINVIAPRQQAKAEQQALELAQEQQKKEEERLNRALVPIDEETEPEEETFTLTTDKVSVTFTNKGGDIISYKLTEHEDKDTGSAVEMADNINYYNRAFALAIGDSNKEIIQDVFNVRRIDDYTIGFYRDYEYTDGTGAKKKFRLGKLYTFKPDEYVFKLDVTINGLDGSAGLDVEGVSYTLRTSPQIGPLYNQSDRYEVRQYVSASGSKKTKKRMDSRYYNKEFDWAGVAGKYFTVLVKPEDTSVFKNSVRTSFEKTGERPDSQIFITRNAIESEQSTDTYYIYVGPRNEKDLLKYNEKDNNAWSLYNTRFNLALQTSGFLSPIEKFLKWSLENINRLAHNWGVAIIILTLLLKIVLYPLSRKSALGTVKMQEIQPQMQALQEKYKDNPQKMQEESSKLYKQIGYNPGSGCLTMVIQMIILFAMYNVFNNYFEFRGAGFISGWIDDLSRPDSVLTWQKEIPLISSFTQNNLRILPFIYTASQLLNGKITQYGNPGGAGQNKNQMALLMYGMPLMFFFILYNAASGLVLYWSTSNILQMVQQIIINGVTKKQRSELAKNKKAVNKYDEKFKSGKKKTR